MMKVRARLESENARRFMGSESVRGGSVKNIEAVNCSGQGSGANMQEISLYSNLSVRIIFAPRVFLFSTSQLILFLSACRANAPAVECVGFLLGRVSERAREQSTRPTATLTCIIPES